MLSIDFPFPIDSQYFVSLPEGNHHFPLDDSPFFTITSSRLTPRAIAAHLLPFLNRELRETRCDHVGHHRGRTGPTRLVKNRPSVRERRWYHILII